jgi:hypothetical protein
MYACMNMHKCACGHVCVCVRVLTSVVPQFFRGFAALLSVSEGAPVILHLCVRVVRECIVCVCG